MNKIELLNQFGLNETEAKVYLELLKLGASKPPKIANMAEIGRTAIYPVLKKLINSGLVTESIQGFDKLYTPTHPKHLEVLLAEQQEKFKNIIPELSEIYESNNYRSELQVYSGIGGIKRLYLEVLDTLKIGDRYQVITHIDKLYELDPEFFANYKNKLIKKNVSAQILVQGNTLAREYTESEIRFNHKAKLLSSNNINVDMIITDYFLILVELTGQVQAIKTTSKAFIDLQSSLFNHIWSTT